MYEFVVKPWSKYESKTLFQHTPKPNKSPPKKEKKKDLDLGLTLKSHGPPTPPDGQQDQGQGVVLQVQKEVYQLRCPKFRNYDVSPSTLWRTREVLKVNRKVRA